jgi:hypothetical protein
MDRTSDQGCAWHCGIPVAFCRRRRAGGIKLYQLYLSRIGLLDEKLFDQYSIRYLIDLLDAGIFAAFVIWGVIDFFRAHRAQEEDDE